MSATDDLLKLCLNGGTRFQKHAALREKIEGILAEERAASPDDLRALGWAVAVHNDYRQGGEPHTFWLFTREGRCVKGEGRTDAEALNAVRAAIEAERGACV